MLPELPPELRCPLHEREFLEGVGSAAPLRIGLMLDEEMCPGILAASLEQVARAGFCEFALVIWNRQFEAAAAAGMPPSGGRWRRLLELYARDEQARRLLAWSALDRWSHRADPELTRLFAPLSLRPLLEGVPGLMVTPETKRFVHRFPAADVERIREAKLDVILRYGFNILRGPILDAARHGVWSYHHGDNDFYRGGPPYFWELAENRATSGVILQRLTEELDGGLILGKGLAATEKALRLGPNRIAGYATGVTLLIEALHGLHRDGEVRGAAPAGDYRGKRKIYRRPGNLEVIRFAAVRAASAVKNRFSPSREYHWRVGLRHAGQDDPLPLESKDYRWLEAPPGRYWADPYVMMHNGQRYLFVEDAPATGGAAHLAAMTLDADLRPGPARPVLERSHHLSNPFVFTDAGRQYLLPESGQAGELQLFEAEAFPYRWKKAGVLLPVAGRDAVLWKREERFYLFFTLREPRWSAPQTWLYWSESLQGPWRVHPRAPVCRDIRFARSAGRPFVWRGKLLRPVQDGSVRYGYALHFMEILEIDPETYRESPLHSVYPEAQESPADGEAPAGIHAFHRQDGMEAIDFQTLRRRS